MDYAHLAYAISLLALAGSAMLIGRSSCKEALRWWLLSAHALAMLLLQVFDALSYGSLRLAYSLSAHCLPPLMAALFLWEFARELLKDSLPKWFGRWTMLFPFSIAVAAAAFLEPRLMAPSICVAALIPAGLAAAVWLLRQESRPMRRTGLALAFYALTATLASFLESQPLHNGWLPAAVCVIGAFGAAALAGSLWKLYLSFAPPALAKARQPRFNAKVLVAVIAAIVALHIIITEDGWIRFKTDLDNDLKEDALLAVRKAEFNLARQGLAQEMLKNSSSIAEGTRFAGMSLRILILSPDAEKAVVFAANETSSRLIPPSTAKEMAAKMVASLRNGGLPELLKPYHDYDGSWISVLTPLFLGDGGSQQFLELRMEKAIYMSLLYNMQQPPLATAFLLSLLAMAFFALVRLHFESRSSLTESERQKDMALWGADAGTWQISFPEGVGRCSPRCRSMLGFEPQEFTVSHLEWESFIHPNDIAQVLQKGQAHIEGKSPSFESEFRVKRKDGSWAWLLARGRVSERNRQGKPLEMSGTIIDISGMKASEEELRSSRLRLKSAESTAGLGVWELNIADNEILWNEQVNIICGLPPGTAPSRALYEATVHPDDLAAMHAARERCIATGYPMEMRYRVRWPDGSTRHLKSDGRLLRDASGRPLKLEGLVMDITDFTIAEEALRKSEREFRSLIENLEDIITRIDGNLKITYISPSITKIIPAKPQDLIGKTHWEAGFDKDACERWEAGIKAVFASGTPMEKEFFYDTPGGRKLFNWRQFPEFGKNGQIVSVLSIVRDVTRRREAEMAFRDIFSNMREGFALCERLPGSAHADFTFLLVNPAFEKLCGLQPAILSGHKASEAPLGIGRDWLDSFAEVLATGAPAHFEGAIKGIDKLFEVSAYRTAPNKFAFILSDATERRRAVEELHKQMLLMKALLDGIPDMVLLMRPDRSIVACNRAARASMGWEEEEMQDCKCFNLLGLSKECDGCTCARTAELCIPSLRNFDSPETGRSYEIRSIPIPSQETGRAEMLVELIRDTTETSTMERDLDRTIDNLQAEILQRMNAEEALRRSEKLHRMITEAAQVGIWQLEPDGKIRYLNPRMREMLEISASASMENLSCFDFIPEEQIKPIDTAQDLQESFIHSYESEIVGIKGSRRNVLVSGIVIYVPGTRRLDAYIETFTDITQIRKAEKETELRKLKLMQTEKMASLGILVSGVAHEINNPTNFIMLNSPILFDVWKSSEPVLDQYAKDNPSFSLAGMPYNEISVLVPELYKSISDGSERIKNIVAGLKDYARQEISDPFATTDINEAVQASLILLANMVKKSTRRFKVAYGKGLPKVKGAKQKIEQVVINLVQNSCQALKNPDCALEIKTLLSDGRVKIVIIDEGCGIPKENMAFILDPFFTTKRDSGGTGLGLSISAGIVNELNGELLFESEPGVGTTAIVSLPPAQEPSTSSEDEH